MRPGPHGSELSSAARANVPPGGEIRLRIFARTDVGQIREHNEDNFLVADLTRKTRGILEQHRTSVVGPHGNLFAVCDGMGGAAAGEIASQLAVDIVYERMVERQNLAAPNRDEIARRLVRSVEAAGLRIFQEAKIDRSRRGMGTTVTAAAIVDEFLFLAQVGDSRGYLLREGQLAQVTRDQSLVNQLIEAGQLTEEEAETFEHNNIILQALGTADTVQVDLTYVELRRGDTLLLCSDGLSGMMRFDDIRELLRKFPEPIDACKALTDRANQAGGHDNITVIVVRFEGDRLRLPGTDGETVKYRKYSLPEEPTENTEPNRRPFPEVSDPAAPPPNLFNNPTGPAPLNVTQRMIAPAPPPSAPPVAPNGWRPAPYGGPVEAEDRIDIPGTHVPAWVVVLLVVGVIALLGATALVLLH